MLFGFLEERHELGEADVDEVARDLAEELMRVLPQPSEAATPAATASNGHDGLAQRMSVLESYVRSHDRTIRRVLKIAADYLEERRSPPRPQ